LRQRSCDQSHEAQTFSSRVNKPSSQRLSAMVAPALVPSVGTGTTLSSIRQKTQPAREHAIDAARKISPP